jgi:hypothetical protein
MKTNSKTLSIGIDGMWTPMELARLLHIVVRSYRLEQLVHLARSGGPDVFRDRLNPVMLKHLAAFDWIAAPLMSARFNDSYVKSEDFIRDYGVSDLRILRIAHAPDDSQSGGLPGEIAFTGAGPVLDTIAVAFGGVLDLWKSRPFIGDDSQGKNSAIEVMYAANMRDKANLMARGGYSDAELHAIVSPSLEDLHFISNAIALGKIATVEKSP